MNKPQKQLNMLTSLGILMILLSITLLSIKSDYYNSFAACLVLLIGGIGMIVQSLFVDNE